MAASGSPLESMGLILAIALPIMVVILVVVVVIIVHFYRRSRYKNRQTSPEMGQKINLHNCRIGFCYE